MRFLTSFLLLFALTGVSEAHKGAAYHRGYLDAAYNYYYNNQVRPNYAYPYQWQPYNYQIYNPYLYGGATYYNPGMTYIMQGPNYYYYYNPTYGIQYYYYRR